MRGVKVQCPLFRGECLPDRLKRTNEHGEIHILREHLAELDGGADGPVFAVFNADDIRRAHEVGRQDFRYGKPLGRYCQGDPLSRNEVVLCHEVRAGEREIPNDARANQAGTGSCLLDGNGYLDPEIEALRFAPILGSIVGIVPYCVHVIT